jgi:hypothetical protein
MIKNVFITLKHENLLLQTLEQNKDCRVHTCMLAPAHTTVSLDYHGEEIKVKTKINGQLQHS